MSILAIRHNNPGNVSLPIAGWHGGGRVVGAPGQAGYAEFPTMAVGFEAFKQRIRSYVERGQNTIARIADIPYATDPHWRYAIAKLSGLDLNAPLDTTEKIVRVCTAIVRQETGHTLQQLGLHLDAQQTDAGET